MGTPLPVSVFFSVRARIPDADNADWPDDFLHTFHAATPADKLDVPVFLPGTFRPGKGREAQNTAGHLAGLTALVLDYDGDQGVAMEAADTALDEYDRVIYTTYRHDATKERFRVVLPLSRTVTVAEYTALQSAFHAHLSRLGVPVQPLPATQCYFFHTVRPNIAAKAVHRPGQRLDPTPWLAQAPPRTSAASTTLRPSARSAALPSLGVPLVAPGGSSPSGGMFSGIENATEKLERIEPKCAFMRRCRTDAATLPEPEWRAWLSVVVRCHDGRRLAHEIGSVHQVCFGHISPHSPDIA
ncbi:MAG: hypothetical protein EBZ48_09880 [Proteobacteria bacterium]|nr:hypothetical protein [Pseudomonadota bacterium]